MKRDLAGLEAGAGDTPPRRDSFAEFCVEQLAGVGRVWSRRMFGGHGIYAEGIFFAIVYRGRLYLKTDETTRGRHEERGMGPFTPSPGQVLRSYHEVPPGIIERRLELAEWARSAIACQARALTRKRARGTRPSTPASRRGRGGRAGR